MGDAKVVLREWALAFVKSRDAFFRKVARFEDVGSDFVAHYKDGKQQLHVIMPSLADLSQFIAKCPPEQHVVLITLNNKENKKAVVEHWKQLAGMKFLTLYFANPVSEGEKKWVIMPHVHDKICDGNLMAGFNSLSEMVAEISEDSAAFRT